MAERTGIQWTDATFNGWWGCTKVGPGCDHCYADALDRRTGGAHWGSGVARRRTSAKNWSEPRRWKPGTRVFCSSMCDVFDNEVPEEWRHDLFELIRATPHLRWQLLTKRIGNVPDMLPEGWPNGFEHVGIMATIVNQDEADRDGPKLERVKALGTTWVGVSYEPALGPVDWTAFAPFLNWLIIGGESGHGARPFSLEWARSAIGQARALGFAAFVKQFGAKPFDQIITPGAVTSRDMRLANKKGGDWTEWPAELRVREFPAALSLAANAEPSPSSHGGV
ncbi:MAG: DUF5131 family protein [Bauldia sp.]|nr:DUF5131 family protein [Bauldia sp.]